MQSTAFTRALNFLNYAALAKWVALACSVLTALLYLALLTVLALFLDLIINRGELPPYYQLPVAEKSLFLEEIAPAEVEERKKLTDEVLRDLNDLGIDKALVPRWLAGDSAENLPPRERLVLWSARLPRVLESEVSAAAGTSVRDEIRAAVQLRGAEAAVNQPIADFGLLSAVVRSRGFFTGWFARAAARVAPWTWEHGNSHYLQGLFLLALALAVLRLGLLFASNYLAAVCVLEAVTRLRRAVYIHTNRLGALAIRALGPAEAVGVSTRHIEAVHEGLYLWLTAYFREPIKFALLLAFALLLNFWLALAFVLFALLVWIVGGQVAAYYRRRGRAALARSAEVLALIQESLLLMRLVKVYLMEPFNQQRVERQLATYTRAQRLRYLGEALYRPLFIFLGLLATMVLLFAVGFTIAHGRLGVTSALTLAAILGSLYWPAVRFLDVRRLLRRTRDSAQALFAFLDRPGGVGQALEAEFIPGLAKQLEFDKVTLKEPGTERKLLRGVSLTIQAGQRVALVGPDEMEKHALVYLLPRFLDPTSGEIRIDGKNIRWVTLDSLRAQIATVLQHNLVFNDTVAHNIGCGDPAFDLQRVIDAAKLAHAHQFIQKLPHGYETPIGEMGHSLALGEQFRIALARAILRDPALLVIEEPTTPLDDDTKAMVDDTLQRVLPGRTVLFLPHRLSTIRNCDRVFLLHQGRIEASGDHRELIATNELYRHLQYLEFNEFAGLVQTASNAVEES